jgi:hypothetical protein
VSVQFDWFSINSVNLVRNDQRTLAEQILIKEHMSRYSKKQTTSPETRSDAMKTAKVRVTKIIDGFTPDFDQIT